MRIDFRVEGGLAAFPGLAQPVRIDCETLPPTDRARLRELVQRADVFGLPAQSHVPALPDARSYTMTIDDGPRCRTVTVREPIADPALRDLIAELRERSLAARRAR